MSETKLFTPVKVGDVTLQHRVVLAPLTRFRADDKHVPLVKLVAEHYAQRAAVRGTMLITEATFISPQAGGYPAVPGIWSQEQIAAWKEIVGAVHERGSFIYLQLWALGRAASPEQLEKEGPYPYISASDVQLTDKPFPPRPLTTEEIKQYVQWYATAASNAVHGAGFDGVEIHGANGYLVDQFLQDVTNKRTDEYGGTIEKRARFALEVVDAIVEKIGAEKTGIRLSPWGAFNDMRMPNPIPTFSYVVQKIAEKHPNFAFVHVVEPRVQGSVDRVAAEGESNDFIREIWQPRALISAGGYNRELAIEIAEKKGDLIGFGRNYIPNPDLPLRLKKNLPLIKYDRSLFYNSGEAKGYVDYPFAPENEAELGKIPVIEATSSNL
ncbi:FMN-linked oxidoreductase [Irpex rosettiformis]|uniref:FMN-linked oxidoreductase n=1 Tax=Irpex rosettiformis TaxID=378272 RepID=A0ACB8U209_9APHY|nr:FMN-linked oxidoreductase [Irpex rosettiformis]